MRMWLRENDIECLLFYCLIHSLLLAPFSTIKLLSSLISLLSNLSYTISITPSAVVSGPHFISRISAFGCTPALLPEALHDPHPANNALLLNIIVLNPSSTVPIAHRLQRVEPGYLFFFLRRVPVHLVRIAAVGEDDADKTGIGERVDGELAVDEEVECVVEEGFASRV